MRRSLALLLILTSLFDWFVVHAGAQEAAPPDVPLMGSEAEQAVTADPQQAVPVFGGDDGVYRIVVIGDALAGGLAAGMGRVAVGNGQVEVLNRANESSSLARPEVYDWAIALPKILAAKSADAVVVLIGVNDRQNIRDGNLRHAFRSPVWLEMYNEQVDRLLAAGATAGSKVFWISMPPMADLGFDADMRMLSDFHRERVAAAKQNFIDIRPYFLTADGSYTDIGKDDSGVERKLRARDGITFFKQGNNRLGQIVLAAILDNERVALPPEAVPQADLNNVPTPAQLSPPGQVDAGVATQGAPAFGQDGLNGESITFGADTVKQAQVGVAGKPAKMPDASASNPVDLRLVAKRGSKAEQFFRNGDAAVAPQGRFDDFAVAPLPP